VSLIFIAVVVITPLSGDGLKKPRRIQHLLLVLTLMEKNCLTYNLTMLLVALVSICELGSESVIKFIAWTLKSRPVFP